jgi:choline dehydrogenase
MTRFDYVIVGAGPAGCVLANRLSADPRVEVLLVEAGGRDTNPLLAIPRVLGEVVGDPSVAWHYPVRLSRQVEIWLRGRTLGGSSAVNGVVYNRGHRADYDALERLGNPGWGWDDMLPAFRAIEDHLHVSTVDGREPLLEDVLTAGAQLGWLRTRDHNESDEERIGYARATLRDGERVSAAEAFLHPVTDRPNLTVAVDTVVDRVELEAGRAVGVVGRGFEARARREVILATGAIATPTILQRSGIGPVDALRSAGVDVVVDSPNVGARLREHRVFLLQVRLAEDLGHNRLLGSEAGRQAAQRQYEATRQGPLATPQSDVVAFFKTRAELDRPDAQIQIGQFSFEQPVEPGKPLLVEREPGMICFGFILRPDSEGAIRITSPDPDVPPDIDANYLATEHDRTTAVDLFRASRRLFATEPLAARIEHETVPGDGVQADHEVIDMWQTTGTCGYHAIGTCAMGPDDDDVVDPQLRVRGVQDLRVVDASVLPIMVSGNLNGPVSALAWRAADLIA